MIDELNTAISEYQAKWTSVVAARHDKVFFESLRAVAVGWKVADKATFDRLSAELHDLSDKVVDTWMNGRWIAKFHLKDAKLNGGIEIIKLMQRRPGSDDAVGLDHLDFYHPEASVAHLKELLADEPNLKWSVEENDVLDDYNWVSIWFGGTEAKLKPSTVIDNIILELRELNEHVVGKGAKDDQAKNAAESRAPRP